MLFSYQVLWRVATATLLVPRALAEGTAAATMNITEPLRSGDPGLQQVLAVPLKRIGHRGVATPSIARRFFKTDVMGVFGAAYLAELTIGTSSNGKKQVVDVLIDTGSFELWVNPVCSASNVPEYCAAFGRYDPAQSSTSRKLDGRGFAIKYGSGGVIGDYYRDDVYISGAKIRDQQFGVANTSDLVWFGIMGLAHGQGNGFINYPLVIDSLAAQGFTNTKLFSMDLGKQVSPGAAVTGEMVFGGVDRNKYAGLLKKVPADPSDPHYKITLSSLAHRAPGARSSTPLVDASLPVPVIVDSGTTLSLLPESVVSRLAAQFPGAEPDGEGGYRVDCAYKGRDGTVDFAFRAAAGTVVINVAYSDFIWDSGKACFLGAWFSDDLDVWILGDTFLRGAYVTFDQTNNALFMSNHLSCGDGQSDLVAVPAGPDAAGRIPGACHKASIPSPPPASTHPSTSAHRTRFPAEPVSHTVVPSATPGSATTSTSTANWTSSQATNRRNESGEQKTRTLTRTATRTASASTTAKARPSGAAPTGSSPPIRPAVTTRFETRITTICTGHEHGHGESASAPPETTNASFEDSSIAATPSIAVVTGAGSPSPPPPPPSSSSSSSTTTAAVVVMTGEESQVRGQGRLATTRTTVTTAAYQDTSYGAGDPAYTADEATAREHTVVQTVRVRPVYTDAAAPVPAPPAEGLGDDARFPGEFGGDTAGVRPGGGGNATTWNGLGGGGGGDGGVVISTAGAVDGLRSSSWLGVVFALAMGFAVLL